MGRRPRCPLRQPARPDIGAVRGVVDRIGPCVIVRSGKSAKDITAALRGLIRLGEDAAAEDPKLRALAADIRAIRAAEPDANILVYTEYADSQDAARDHLLADPSVGGAILVISGADPDHRRDVAHQQQDAQGQSLNRAQIEEQLEALLSDLHVKHLRDSPSVALSGGERRRAIRGRLAAGASRRRHPIV